MNFWGTIFIVVVVMGIAVLFLGLGVFDQKGESAATKDILISPNEGDKMFTTNEEIRISWSEEVEYIFIIWADQGCDARKIGFILNPEQQLAFGDVSGCPRKILYGGPPRTGGSLLYDLKGAGLKEGEYYVMAVTPFNEYDLAGPIHIERALNQQEERQPASLLFALDRGAAGE